MLTPTEITKAIKTATSEAWLTDTSEGRGTGSLRLRIRPSADGATATWVVQWKQADGAKAFKQLGRYPTLTIVAARELYRQEVVPVLLAGKDPRVAVAAEGKPTVARLFQGYVDHLKAKGQPSAAETERMLLRAKYSAAGQLGRERIAATVGPDDVVAYVSRFYDEGHPGAADKARSYVSAAFGWAIKATHDYKNKGRQDWGVKVNPAEAVKRDEDATTARDRNLDADELRRVWHAARPGRNGFTLETAACLRLLIGTGQRVTAVLRIEGAELDLDAATWRMPKHKTKGRKRDHITPLPKAALPILRALKAEHGDGWLFPARTDAKGETMDHRSVMQALERWMVAAKLPAAERFQTRDIRRTWKSRCGEIGISKEMRDLMQQHAKNDTSSKHYDLADYLPQMRAAMDLWHRWLVRNVVRRGAENPQEAATRLAA